MKETENAEKAESAAGTTDMQGKLPASARGNKAEIVIVEDEEDIQDYLKAQLASDFKIRTYPNGKVALNEILKNKPDLIISGVADAGWTAIGLAVGTYLNFLLVARKIRRYSVKLDAITIPTLQAGNQKP